MFPEELPKRLIKMFAFKEETVLDPFMGSGTIQFAT
jgi:DNA modification methylase